MRKRPIQQEVFIDFVEDDYILNADLVVLVPHEAHYA